MPDLTETFLTAFAAHMKRRSIGKYRSAIIEMTPGREPFRLTVEQLDVAAKRALAAKASTSIAERRDEPIWRSYQSKGHVVSHILRSSVLLISLAVAACSAGPASTAAKAPGWTGTTTVPGNNSSVAGNAEATYQQQRWPLQKR